MKSTNKKGFSLVELLVVITILSIISVVAYQNFGGATAKAIASRKKTDISTIETALQQFKTEKNYYPMPQNFDASENLWGYNSGTTASPSNKIQVTYNGQEIDTIIIANTIGGGKVEYSTGGTTYQLGAKGVVGYNGDFGKTYLSKELYDPELGDVNVKSTSSKMIDYGIGKYVYGIYATPKTANWNISQANGSYYNIATSIKNVDKDVYETYIVGDYDSNSCKLATVVCPETLISDGTETLENDMTQSGATTDDNQGIPYPITDFSM